MLYSRLSFTKERGDYIFRKGGNKKLKLGMITKTMLRKMILK